MSALNEDTAAALREAGYDPERYAPVNAPLAAPSQATVPVNTPQPMPVEQPEPSFFDSPDLWSQGHGIQPEPTFAPGPEEESLPEDVRNIGKYRQQLDYAVQQVQSPARQLDMYARMNDVLGMARVIENSNELSDEEVEEIALRIQVPPEMVKLLHKEYPNELEQRKQFAKMLAVADPDSYFVERFSHDPKYAAVNRKHVTTLADLQAAVKNVYASNAEIMSGKLKDAWNGIITETFYGIPASMGQAANDFRNLPVPEPMQESAIPDGLRESDPRLFMELTARNRSIQAYNNQLAIEANKLGSTPEEVARKRREIKEGVADFNIWARERYEDRGAQTYSGHTETGNWWLDVPVSATLQALPSLATAMIEGYLLGPIAPVLHFGGMKTSSAYRDMRAENVHPEIALPAAISAGIIEGTLEGVNVKFLSGRHGVGPAIRRAAGPSVSLASRIARLLTGLFEGGVENAVQEKLQNISGNAHHALAKSISLGDPYLNVLTAITDGIAPGGEDLGNFFAGVIGASFGSGAGREFSDARSHRRFQKAAQPLVAAGDALIQSGKSVAEARGEVRNMAHAAVAKGDGTMGTTVYADPGDVESYLQGKSKEDAEKALSAIGVTPDEFRQAQADQTDLEVSIENFAVQEGGSDPELTRLFRPTPNMATAAAMAARTNEVASVFELARTLRQEIDADVDGKVAPEAIRTLRQDLTTRLNYRAQEADFTASLIWAWAKTQADRRGMDLEQMLADNGNIRAAMDGWIRQNQAWMEGVRARTPAAETEEVYEESNDASTIFDPALGEESMDIPEQPDSDSGELSETESGPAAQPVDSGSGEPGGQDVRPSAAEQTGTLFSPAPRPVQPGEYADNLTGLPYTMETVTTEGVRTDPGALQFKRNADPETGVKKGAEIQGDVNPAAIGTMVLYEDVDGDRFVVSGHHRLDLLRRKGEEAEVRAVILRENDGWSTDHARLYGAAINILDGGGDVDDYATFFRETRGRLSKEEAEAQGLFRGERARTGYAIGALGSDNVFYGYLNEELTAKEAASIANAAPSDAAIQDLMIEREIPVKEMETFAGYVRRMRNSGALNLDGVQLSLFADANHSAMLAAMEKESKAAAKQASELDKKAAGLESLVKADKVLSTAELRKYGARAGDREGLRMEAAELRAEADRWRKFYQHPDILAQVQERAGTAPTIETFSQPNSKRPFYRAEDLDAVAGKTAAVVEATLPEWNGSRKELRRHAFAEILKLREEPIVNGDTGWEIQINRRSAEESTHEPRTDVELLTIGKIPELLKVAVQAADSTYEKGDYSLAERGIKAYHRFYAPLLVGDDLYAVQMTVKERFEEGHSFYLHRLKISDPAGKLVNGETDSPRTPLAGSQYSIPELLRNVKDGGPETYAQPAYHGSPHRFDRFSLDAIGRGEGTQIEGWGLYFASQKAVAENYRGRLSGYTINGKPIQDYLERNASDDVWSSIPEYEMLSDSIDRILLERSTIQDEITIANWEIGKAAFGIKRDLQWFKEQDVSPLRHVAEVNQKIERIRNHIRLLESLEGATFERNRGALYEVDIPGDDVILDFEVPLREQPENVKNALGSVINDSHLKMTGSEFYQTLSRTLGGDRQASEMLNSVGVKGIKYLDALSKIDGTGTSNYVIFDDNAIQIIETYYQENRGEVQLYKADATHRQAAVIRVMKGGDMSTVLHELAHIFLADMRDYVSAGGADIGTVRDYGKLLAAAGDLTQTENAEQVVRWFEEYLREGKAPSVELVKPFGLFSKWLTNVYGNVRQYVGPEMNADTRGVFDRWLASEREIAEAEAYYGGLYSADFLNLVDDDDERKELEEQLERKRQRVLNRHAGQMAKAWTEANVNRDKMAAAAENEAMKQPVYRAIRAAKASGLDKAAAEKTVGKGTVLKIMDIHGNVFAKEIKPIELKAALRKVGYTEQEPVAAFLKELSEAVPVEEAVRQQGSHGRRKRYYEALEVIARAGGIDPAILADIDPDTMAGLKKHSGLFQADGRENLDRIAMETGFATPSAMLDTMAKTPDMETVVKRMTERMVRAEAKKARAWAEESLTEVIDDTSPSGQSALHDPNEDAMAEGIELQRDALRRAIEAKTRRRASYLGRRVLEDKAKRDLRSKSLRDAMNYNNYAKTERYWSGVAAEAMAKGDKEKALAALDNQQKFHAMSTEAFRIRRDFTDFMRRYGQRMAQSELASVHDEYRDAARDILVFTGVVVDRSGRFAPANSDPDRLILPQAQRDEYDLSESGDPDASLDAFHAPMETLIPEWIRLKRLPKGFMGNILDLTPDHMADIDASIKTLVKYGREELTALRDKDNQTISDLRDKLMATMATLSDKRRLNNKKTLDRMQSTWDNYLSGNLSIDALAEEVDGFTLHMGKGMGLMQTLIDAIRGGEVKQSVILEQFKNATKSDFRTIDGLLARLKKEHGTFFNPDGVRSPSELTDGASADTEWEREMILSVMFNIGNKGNLYALQQGYGLTDAEMNRLTSLATEKEWLAVQHIAQEMGSLFDELDAVHYRLTNRHLEKVRTEKLTVLTADGKLLELDGWYYPLVFDPNLNDSVGKNAEAAEYRAVMSAVFSPQKLNDGFVHSRQVDEDGNPVVTYPPLLSSKVIIDHMTTATRWMFLAEPLMEFRRVTMDPEFKKLFIQKLGADRYRDLRMWTNRMARPDKGADEAWNKVFRKLKNASTVASLGLNLKSAVRQLSSGGLAADTMSKASRTKASGWYFMWRGLRKMGFQGSFSRLLSPLGLKSAATEEMFRLAPEAKFRAENVNKDIRDALDKFRPTSGKASRAWQRVKNALFHFTIASDHLISGAAWWGAFEQATTGNAGFDIKGLTQDEIQAKAVKYANYVVRTQQSPYQADYTRLQADNGAISLMTSFMGGLTPYLNNTYINVQLARRLGWKHAMPLGTHILNAYVLPSVVLTTLLREIWSALTGDDDDDEEHALAWDLAEEITGQAVGGLPMVRDVARWGIRRARTGRNDLGSTTPPAIAFPYRVGGRIATSIEEMLDGDAYAAGKDVGMAVAEVLGVAAPIRQLKPLAEAWDLVESE